jgi:hypothetical protein
MKKLVALLIVSVCIMALFIPIGQAYTKTYTYTDAQVDTVTRVLMAECPNQPFYGQVAVASTAIYRYENNHGKYSMEYITRRSQYAKKGKWVTCSKNKQIRAAYEKCKKAVLWVIDHRVLPKNCTMFKRADRKTWSSRGCGRRIYRYCRIGAHTFYTNGPAKPVKGPLYIGQDGKLKVKNVW